MYGFKVWMEDQSPEALRQKLADLWKHREDQAATAEFIQDNFPQIIADTGSNWGNPSSLLMAIELVQYMDDPRMFHFRNWFMSELKKHGADAKSHPNFSQYQFLNTKDDSQREGPFAHAFNLALNEFKLGQTSYHGPVHWRNVESNAMKLIEMGAPADPTVCRLFGILHDCKRENEANDPMHGHRIADLLPELGLRISTSQLHKLIEACRYHNDGKTSTDPTIGVCWDADRLDLPRVGIDPDPQRLSTEQARELVMGKQQVNEEKKDFLQRFPYIGQTFSHPWREPEKSYQSPTQAKSDLWQAYIRAQQMNKEAGGRATVYHVLGGAWEGTSNKYDLSQMLSFLTKPTRQEVSVSVKKGVWNTGMVLEGKAKLLLYYSQDVSSIYTPQKQLIPIKPFEPDTHYDEGIVKLMDVGDGRPPLWSKLHIDETDPGVQRLGGFDAIARIAWTHGLEVDQASESEPVSPIGRTAMRQSTFGRIPK